MASNWTDKALRKLDALCAERVMGWERTGYGGDQVWADNSRDTPMLREFFEPSFEWEDAGEVVEKMMDLRFGYSIACIGPCLFVAFGSLADKNEKSSEACSGAPTAHPRHHPSRRSRVQREDGGADYGGMQCQLTRSRG